MSETRTVHDPFLGKDVQVSDRLIDRLRGKYASGPHLPNGNPEFGWRQFQAPPIQHEAAAEIERLHATLAAAQEVIRAASMMANVCYNAKQNSDVPEGIRVWLANTQEGFDKARDGYLGVVGGSKAP